MLHPLAGALLAFAPMLPIPPLDDGDGVRTALVPVGDVDGDGFDDVALAHRAQPTGMGTLPEGGESVAQRPVVLILSSADGTVLRRFEGSKGFGTELEPVGDHDGDGVVDLLVGHGRGGAERGVHLISPGKGTVLHRFAKPARTRSFGRALAGGEQLVGDPTPDLVLGVEGGAWIVDGATLLPTEVLVPKRGALHRVPVEGWDWPQVDGEALELGPAPPTSSSYDRRFITDVALLPDQDGDGVGELVMTTRQDPTITPVMGERPAQLPYFARVLPSAGREPLALETAAWCAVAGVDLDGDGVGDLVTTTVNRRMRAWSLAKRALIWEQQYDWGYMYAEGTSLAWTSDLDGDGVRDLVTAANETFFDADSGWIELVSGATGTRITQRPTPAWPDPDRKGLRGGADVAVVSDMNDDGAPELVAQFPTLRRVDLLHGKTLETLWTLDPDELAAQDGARLDEERTSTKDGADEGDAPESPGGGD